MAERLLRERLGSYLKMQGQAEGAHFERDFVCPKRLLNMQAALALFQWVQWRDNGHMRVLGIRRLVDRSPFRLSDLRARGFNIESIRYPIRPPVEGSVEHYFIAELLGAWEAKVFLCMHVP